MRWNLHFPDFEIPDQIQQMVKNGILIDTTYPNDSCPSFSSRLSTGLILSIRIAHPDKKSRSKMCSFRYTLSTRNSWDGPAKDIWFTNDLEDMTVEFYAIYAEHGGQRGKFRLMGL
jgi:hypothetical protein